MGWRNSRRMIQEWMYFLVDSANSSTPPGLSTRWNSASAAVLVDQMMKRLVTEHHVHRLVRQRQAGAVGLPQVHGDAVPRGGLGRGLEHVLVHVDADQLPRRETLLQQFEGTAPAAADIDDHRVAAAAILDQPLQIVHRPLQDMDRPGLGIEEPDAETRFRHLLAMRRGFAAHGRRCRPAAFPSPKEARWRRRPHALYGAAPSLVAQLRDDRKRTCDEGDCLP